MLTKTATDRDPKRAFTATKIFFASDSGSPMTVDVLDALAPDSARRFVVHDPATRVARQAVRGWPGGQREGGMDDP
jgi:hypothetical protein